MSAKGTLGWVILAVALSVPAFMFWNWWQAMNTRKPEVKLKPNPLVFGGGSMTKDMSNPLATPSSASRPAQGWTTPNTTVPQGVAGRVDPKPFPGAKAQEPARAEGPSGPASAAPEKPAKTTALQPGSATPATVLPAGSAPLPSAPVSPAAAASPAMPVTAAMATAAQAAAKAAATANIPESGDFNPMTARDPTMSPADLRKLAKKEHDRQVALDELTKQATATRDRTSTRKTRVPAKPPEPPIETRIEVVGIISVDRAAPTAIVNGQILKQGDSVLGAKVVKITTGGVVFSYRKGSILKTFTKTVKK
ncbi:MAG: hypothetical protein HY078_00135 [Elusimicrobia bacterium]|nr:hypothetical protein [Elusimicrobiota bacterium]